MSSVGKRSEETDTVEAMNQGMNWCSMFEDRLTLTSII